MVPAELVGLLGAVGVGAGGQAFTQDAFQVSEAQGDIRLNCRDVGQVFVQWIVLAHWLPPPCQRQRRAHAQQGDRQGEQSPHERWRPTKDEADALDRRLRQQN